jgi:hypothetical protein
MVEKRVASFDLPSPFYLPWWYTQTKLLEGLNAATRKKPTLSEPATEFHRIVIEQSGFATAC